MCPPPQATSAAAAAVSHPLPAAPAAAGPPAAGAPTPAAGTTAAAAGTVTGVTASGPRAPPEVAAATSGHPPAAAAAAGASAAPALTAGLGLAAGTTAAAAGPVTGVTAGPPASPATAAPVTGVTAGLSASPPHPSPQPEGQATAAAPALVDLSDDDAPVPVRSGPKRFIKRVGQEWVWTDERPSYLPPSPDKAAAPSTPAASSRPSLSAADSPAVAGKGVGPAVPRTTTIEVVPVLADRELVQKGEPPRDSLWLPDRVGQDPRAPPQPLPSSRRPVCFLLVPGFVPVPDRPPSHLCRPHKPQQQKRPRSPSPEPSSSDPLGLLDSKQPSGSKATQSRNARRKQNRAAYAAKAKADGKVNRQTLKNLNRSSSQYQKRAKEHWDAAQAAYQRKFEDEARRLFTLANNTLSKAFRTLHLLAKLGDSLPVSAAVLRRTVFNAEELIAFPL